MAHHPIVNVHTHSFNFNCVPNGFLSNYVNRGLASIAGRLLRTQLLGSIIKALLKRFPMTRKFATLVAVGTNRTQLDVFETMLQSYVGKDCYFVALPMNFDYMGGGSMPSNYITQIAEVEDIKRQYKDRFIPFLAIDPRMGSSRMLLDFVKSYFEPKPGYTKGFAGIKIYPSLGFFPFDPRLELVYDYAQKHEIPILAHCTRHGAFYAGKKLPPELLSLESFNPTQYSTQRHKQQQYINMKKLKLSESCDNYLDPVNYIDVLDKFPSLKLCFAHFGGDDEMVAAIKANAPVPTEASGLLGFNIKTSWYNIILFIMNKYKNVYSDISYTLYNKHVWFELNALMAGKLNLQQGELNNFGSKIPKRILFGTDFFMTTQEKPEDRLYNDFIEGLSDLKTFKTIAWDNPKEFLRSSFFAIK